MKRSTRIEIYAGVLLVVVVAVLITGFEAEINSMVAPFRGILP